MLLAAGVSGIIYYIKQTQPISAFSNLKGFDYLNTIDVLELGESKKRKMVTFKPNQTQYTIKLKSDKYSVTYYDPIFYEAGKKIESDTLLNKYQGIALALMRHIINSSGARSKAYEIQFRHSLPKTIGESTGK